MMKRLVGAAILAVLATPVGASTYVEVQTVCPVGSKVFTHSALGSYTSFGSLPDGMPFGSVDFPIALTECPDNGLVLYRDFEAAETPELTRIVTSPDYQTMRDMERSYYRAHHLAVALGDKAETVGSLLQSAWWQANNAGDAEQAARYGTAFVDWAAAQPVSDDAVLTFMIQLRRVNALRELGRFDEAEAVRTALPALPSDSPLPPGAREQLTQFAARLGPSIERRDASRSPIDLLPPREAAARCLDSADQEPFARAYCDSPGMAGALAGARQVRADLKRLDEEPAHDHTD